MNSRNYESSYIIDSIADLVPAVKPQMAFFMHAVLKGVLAIFFRILYSKRYRLLFEWSNYEEN